MFSYFCSWLNSLEDLHMWERIFVGIRLTQTFSQINAIIDIALPIPRNINAGNKNVKRRVKQILTRNVNLYRSIPFQGPSILPPRQIAPTLWWAWEGQPVKM